MTSNEELLKKISSAGTPEELRSLLAKEQPALLNRLTPDDLAAVAGGMTSEREEYLNTLLKIWKQLRISEENVFSGASETCHLTDEDVEYIKAHYGSITTD